MTTVIEMRFALAIIGIALGTIGCIGGLGIFLEYELLSTWSGPVPISVPSNVGFVLAGIGFGIIAYREKYWEKWNQWNNSDRR